MRLIWLTIVAALGLMLWALLPVTAHEAPSRVEVKEVTAHTLEIALYDEQPYVRRPVRFTVRALPAGTLLRCVAVTALGWPFVETRAIPTRLVRLRPDPEEPERCAGEVLVPVQGLWDLEIHVAAPAGREVARVSLTVAAPHAMPKWIAWLIGLSPLAGIARFAWGQRGYLRRLRAEADFR